MSHLENSVSSEHESPTRAKRHSLCQDLQELELRLEMRGERTPAQDAESEGEGNSSYILPNSNNKLEDQPELEDNSKHEEPEPEKQLDRDAEGEDECDSSSPKTITLIEDDIKDSINMSSKISQYSLEVDNESFATFLSIRDNSYASAVKSFHLLFESVNNLFGDRLKTISQTYLSFLKIKLNQEKSYEATNLCHPQNNRNHIIYVDCKTVSDQIYGRVAAEKGRRMGYLKAIEACHAKLEKAIQQSSAGLAAKQAKIVELHRKITVIANQMSQLMIPQTRKKNKKAINPQIYECSFIRTKYLMNQERAYLNLIATYLQAVLAFVSHVCLELEPKNCLAVKECLLGYSQALTLFEPTCAISLDSSIKALNKTNCYQQTYEQVARLLELCIPQSIKPSFSLSTSSQPSEKKLKKLIEGLISESQDLIYIPVIELESKDYAYHSKNRANVRWVKVNHERKYKEETIEEHNTYVILTHQGNLILQLLDSEENKQQKMAILKLRNLKLSRKNNKVYLSDKGTGMLGYLFSNQAVLGSLIFEPLAASSSDPLYSQSTLVEEFIQRVKDIVDDKKDKKQKEKLKEKEREKLAIK